MDLKNILPEIISKNIAAKQKGVNAINDIKQLKSFEPIGLGMNFDSDITPTTLNDIQDMNRTNIGMRDVLEQARMNEAAMNGNPYDLNIASKPFDGKYIATEDHNLGKGLYNTLTGIYGSKATRNNNPGNITGAGGKLLYGASGIASSPVGDTGDRTQLVFDSPKAGARAMRNLMSSKSYNNQGIAKDFAKWQSDKKAWNNMLIGLKDKGIDTNKTFNQLSPENQYIMLNQRASHEGYKGSPLTMDMFGY